MNDQACPWQDWSQGMQHQELLHTCSKLVKHSKVSNLKKDMEVNEPCKLSPENASINESGIFCNRNIFHCTYEMV